MLKYNLIANYIGQCWTTLMGFAFIPFYIKFLGIEAYGLIGFFALLQAWLSILDMGMAPTLSREMARRTTSGHDTKTLRDLLRSIEIIAALIAIIIAACVYTGSSWLSRSWVNSETISNEDVASAIAIMGLVIATRFVETIYKSSINGLQKQVLLNVVVSSMATLRGGGAVVILAFVSPSINAFIFWQGIISIITVCLLAVATYKSLPAHGYRGRFSWAELQSVKNFAGGILGISILSLTVTQIDKVLLSIMLSLTDFAYYTLASLVAISLYMFVSPITKAWFPILAQLHKVGDEVELALKFHQGAQLVSVIAGSAALVLIFQGETFLRLWTQDDLLSARVAPILSLLALGYLLNMLLWIPFETQLAFASVKLPMKTSLAAVVFMVPAVFILAFYYGPKGAAIAWILLNLGHILISVPLMFRTILSNEKWQWYFKDIITPLLPPAAIMLLLDKVMPEASGIKQQITVLFLYSSLTLLTTAMLVSHGRQYIFRYLAERRFYKRLFT